VIDLARLWAELRRDTSERSGIVRRRLGLDAPCKVFAGMEQPNGHPCLITEFSHSVKTSGGKLPQSRGFATVVQALEAQDPGNQGKRLIVTLTDSSSEDIFATLCEDLCDVAKSASSEAECVALELERLARWQRFLQKHSGSGLTEEEQRGLLGELVFLKDVAMPRIEHRLAVESWLGPKGNAQDFEFEGGGVEVKATIAAPPQTIQVSSVRQLDNLGLPSLFLYVLPLQPHVSAGRSLPDIVRDVRQHLAEEPQAARLLDDRLTDAGYMDSHAEKYEGDRYAFRPPSFFRVREGFPRIVEADLMDGVGCVEYSLALSACAPFVVDEAEAVAILGLNASAI